MTSDDPKPPDPLDEAADIAAQADNGFAGVFGRLERLDLDGKLVAIMVGYAYKADNGRIATSYTFAPDNIIWALGLWHAIDGMLADPANQEKDTESEDLP